MTDQALRALAEEIQREATLYQNEVPAHSCVMMERWSRELARIADEAESKPRDLLAYGEGESASALKAKDRDQYQFWQGWNAALQRFVDAAALAAGLDAAPPPDELAWWKEKMQQAVKAGGELEAEIHRLKAALAAALAHPPQGWQPIETAPKDGTPLLLARKQALSGELIVVSGSWNSGGAMHLPHWMSAVLGFRPTHWMPLPPAALVVSPPELEETKEDDHTRVDGQPKLGDGATASQHEVP